MPTNRPRVTFTSDEELQITLKRFARLSGKSLGSTVYDLLKQSQPHLDELCDIIEDVESRKSESGIKIKDFVNQLTKMSEQNIKKYAYGEGEKEEPAGRGS
jgi:predicted transcriptional regulator